MPAGERFCRWPFGARAGDGDHDGEVVPGASHSLAFMTELVELQHWRCAATYAVRAPRQLGGEARDRALAAARNLTVFFPEGRVHAVIRAAAEGNQAKAE